MSYVSLLKNVPEFLSRPTGIAVIASLGIHAAIALIVPLMPVDSDSSQPSEAPQSVGILELSQADQERLPENPKVSPETFQSSLPTELSLSARPPLLPPNLDIRTNLPPLPSSPQTQPVLPPVRTTINYPTVAANPNISLPQRPPTPKPEPRIESKAPQQQYRFTPDFNAAAQRFTPSRRTFNHSEIQLAVNPIPVDKLPKVNPSPLPADLVNTPPTTTAVSNNATSGTTKDDAAQTPRHQALVDRLQQSRQQPEQLDNQNTAKLQPAFTPEKTQLPAQKVNPEQGAIALLNSHQQLRQQIQQEYPNSQQKPVLRDTITVNQPQMEGTVWGFLVVGTQGEVLDIKFPRELVSTELESKARKYFSANSPQGDRQVSIYPFNLSFQKNGNTAATTVKPLPELRIPNNQQSAPAEAVTAKTTPETNNTSLNSTLESSEKLIQQLRQMREERTNSNLGKSN